MAFLINAFNSEQSDEYWQIVFCKHFNKILLLQLKPFYSDGDRDRGCNALEDEEILWFKLITLKLFYCMSNAYSHLVLLLVISLFLNCII